MQSSSVLAWFAKCAATAAVLLIACGMATARFGAALQMPSVTTRDGTLVTLNRYVSEPVPDVVLVGSSLTWRLKEELFATPRVRNLALAGGSPVTGLAIVASQLRVPRIVLVEANVLSRPIDAALISKFSRKGAAEPLMFRPVRAAVAAFERWNHGPPSQAQSAVVRDQLMRQPPSDFDNKLYLDRAMDQFNAEDPAQPVHENVQRIAELIVAIEQAGARVLLMDVPYSEPVRGAKASRITRQIIHEAFPDPARWLQLSLPDEELRWLDGVHLDERSALVVALAIDRALAAFSESG